MKNIEFGPGVVIAGDQVLGTVEEPLVIEECPDDLCDAKNLLYMSRPKDYDSLEFFFVQPNLEFVRILRGMYVNNWRKLHGLQKIRKRQLFKARLMDMKKGIPIQFLPVQGTSSMSY